MTRSQLIADLAANHPQLSLRDVESAVETILSAIMQAVAEGRRVEIRNFGVFLALHRQACQVRNPKTGETRLRDATRFPKFRPGRAFQGMLSVNAGQFEGAESRPVILSSREYRRPKAP